MQKIVLKVGLHDEKIKQKAMKTVSGLQGVESESVDMKESKMTVVGGIDAVAVAGKLRRKLCTADILSVGPAKEEPKKEPKKEEKKEEKKPETVPCICYSHYPPYPSYYVTAVDQNPGGCVIL